MQIQKSFKSQSPYGKLYLVATPIGNMDDMSIRMINTLKEVDFIAAEDTRNTGLLLKHFDITTKQISFHEHNAKEKIPDLIRLLKSGRDIAQVSDAGLPSISDPGHDLVKAAIAEEIAVVTVPGPSAGISALIASGLAPQPHIFYGFLPRKVGQQKEFFEKEYNKKIKIWKAFSVKDSLPEIKEYSKYIEFPLFDAKEVNAGGNGIIFDWSILSSMEKCSFILAGGLEKENIAEALSYSPAILDVNSKVEINNRKNRKLIEEVISEIRNKNLQ